MMSTAAKPDSPGVRVPAPFVFLGALLLGLAAEQIVALRSFGIESRVDGSHLSGNQQPA